MVVILSGLQWDYSDRDYRITVDYSDSALITAPADSGITVDYGDSALFEAPIPGTPIPGTQDTNSGDTILIRSAHVPPIPGTRY